MYGIRRNVRGMPLVLGAAFAAAMLVNPAADARSPSAPNERSAPGRGELDTGPRGVGETAPMSGGYVVPGGPNRYSGAPQHVREGNVGDADRLAGERKENGLSLTDRQLMRTLASAQLVEIRMAALATANSGNPAVRSYAERMLEEHTRAMDELRVIADKYSVVLPGGVDTEKVARLREMALKTGEEFDRLYMELAGTADHEEAHRLFEEAASRAAAPELKAYIAGLMPMLGDHLRVAKEMQANPRHAEHIVRSSAMAGQSTSGSGVARFQSSSGAGDRGSASISGSAVHTQGGAK